MTKGAVMGVYVLGGFILFILACVIVTMVFWLHRARQLEMLETGGAHSLS